MVRTVVLREPDWTEQDRAEAQALLFYRAGICPGGCGQPLTESTSNYETGPQYGAKRIRCRACDARAELAEEMSAKKVDRPEAVLVRVEKVRG
jgi:hypothetical protein